MKKRKRYTAEFKREAVRLYKTSGRSLTQIEQDLGIGTGCLGRWKRELEDAGEQAFPGQGHLGLEQEQIRRLKRENEILRQERDILKKAVTIFSQPNK